MTDENHYKDMLQDLISKNPKVATLTIKMCLTALLCQHKIAVVSLHETLAHAMGCGCANCQRAAPMAVKALASFNMDIGLLTSVSRQMDDFSTNYLAPTEEEAAAFISNVEAEIEDATISKQKDEIVDLLERSLAKWTDAPFESEMEAPIDDKPQAE